MSAVAENGISHIVEMRDLRFVADNAALELTGISHHHPVADDDIFAHITPAADVTILSDPGRALQYRPLFDNCAGTHEYGVADERFPHQLPKNSRFKPKLKITGNLFQCVPDKTLVFKQLGMGCVFEADKLSRGKNFFRAECRHDA